MKNGWKAVSVFISAMAAVCYLAATKNDTLATAIATGIFALMHSSLIGDRRKVAEQPGDPETGK